MRYTPTMSITLESAPDELGKYKLRAGSGSNFAFNLHVISAEPSKLLPVGQYSLKYTASCESQESRNTNVKTLAEVVGVPSDKLIEQLCAAGIEVTHEQDQLSDNDKKELLRYLRQSHTPDG